TAAGTQLPVVLGLVQVLQDGPRGVGHRGQGGRQMGRAVDQPGGGIDAVPVGRGTVARTVPGREPPEAAVGGKPGRRPAAGAPRQGLRLARVATPASAHRSTAPGGRRRRRSSRSSPYWNTNRPRSALLKRSPATVP